MIQQYKIDAVANLKSRMDGAKAIVLIDYKGINIEEVNALRRKLREAGVDYFVSKNTFIKIALNDLGITDLDPHLKGPTSVAVSLHDEVAPAREIHGFANQELKDKDYLRFKMGYVNGSLLEPSELDRLAKLPTREELIAKTLAGLNAPITGFVGVLSGIIRSFVYTIDAIAKKAENKE